jgi:spore germination protein GerM
LPERLSDALKARFIIRKLLESPEADYLENPIPMGTKLRGFYINRDIAILDFSGEIRNNLMGGLSAEQLCIYSIVNSIVLNCESIDRVQILIEGKKADTLRGNLDISVPIVEDVSLIRW